MTEISTQFQRFDPAVRDVLLQKRVTYVKVVNPGQDNHWPGLRVIGRVHREDEASLIAQGAVGAERWWQQYGGLIDRAPYLWGAQTCNEPHGNWSTVDAYAARWAELAHQRRPGLFVIGPAFSEGEPEPEDGKYFTRSSEVLDGWAFNEYFLPHRWAQDATWHFWRYPRFLAHVPVAARSKPVFITEAGIDGRIEGNRHGWTHYLNGDRTTYAEWIRRYVAGLTPQVVSVFLFVTGPEDDWEEFVIDAPLGQMTFGGEVPNLDMPVKEDRVIFKGAEGVEYREAPNRISMYWSSRSGQPIRYLVLHSTEGPKGAAFSWWASANNPVKSSAHDLIDTAGVVWQCVPYELAAHHCGGSVIPGFTGWVNAPTIGVELEYPKLPASPEYTAPQWKAAVKHCKWLVRKYNIPRENCYRHSDIAKGNQDPRNFDWGRFLDEVYGAEREGLPEDEAVTDPAKIAEKIRWWTEEMQRQYEAQQLERANAIRLSLIKLLYRLENALKQP